MQVKIPTSDHPLVRTVFTLPDGSKLAVESERGAKTASVVLPEGVADENVQVVTYFMSGRTVKGQVLVQEAKPVEETTPEVVTYREVVKLDPRLFTPSPTPEWRPGPMPEWRPGPTGPLEPEDEPTDEEVEEIEKELDEQREGLDAGPVYSNKPADE